MGHRCGGAVGFAGCDDLGVGDVTDLHRFINALRILANIDRWQLEEAGVKMDDAHWSRFTNSIDIWFMKASDDDAAKVWQLIEARQPKEPT